MHVCFSLEKDDALSRLLLHTGTQARPGVFGLAVGRICSGSLFAWRTSLPSLDPCRPLTCLLLIKACHALFVFKI